MMTKKLSDFIDHEKIVIPEGRSREELIKYIVHLEDVIDSLADRLRARDDRHEILCKRLTSLNIDVTIDQ
jgi:hypothetical protein